MLVVKVDKLHLLEVELNRDDDEQPVVSSDVDSPCIH